MGVILPKHFDESYGCRVFAGSRGFGGARMKMESLRTMERIREVEIMCTRDEPLYERISSFGVALYVIGCADCDDLMSMEDVDDRDAADFLRSHCSKLSKIEMDGCFRISDSTEKYLMVLGDPNFPKHFAVIVDMRSKRPFFSKLRYFGAGFDNLEELLNEYSDSGVAGYEDVHYFRLEKNRPQTASMQPQGRLTDTARKGGKAELEFSGVLEKVAV